MRPMADAIGQTTINGGRKYPAKGAFCDDLNFTKGFRLVDDASAKHQASRDVACVIDVTFIPGAI